DRPHLALDYAERALGLDASNAEAEFYRARALTLLNRKQEAHISYRRAAGLDSNFLTPFGIWLIEEGRLDEAQEILAERLARQPHDG
ncbi:hypothetical protein ABTM79_19470, partial [Acinetobacter baumannii]